MRWKSLIVIAGLALAALAAPTGESRAADIFIKGRFGDVDVGISTGGFRHRYGRYHRKPYWRLPDVPPDSPPLKGYRRDRDKPFFGGVVNDIARDNHAAAQEARPYRRPPYHHRRYRRPGYIPEAYYHDGLGDPPAETEAAAAPAPEAAPVPEVIEIDPPDARGPSFERARGSGPAVAPAYQVGAPLPRGMPHVALDWQDYNLPRPPAGQTYARFGGAVLLIETDTRVVRQVLWPVQG